MDTLLFTMWNLFIIYSICPPSLSLMDGGVLGDQVGGAEISSISPANETQFNLMSGVEGLGVRGGLVWTRQPVIGFEAEQISWDWICGRGWWENRESRGVHRRSMHRSLPSPVAPGLVILKGGRLKGLMEAGVMLCGVI